MLANKIKNTNMCIWNTMLNHIQCFENFFFTFLKFLTKIISLYDLFNIIKACPLKAKQKWHDCSHKIETFLK